MATASVCIVTYNSASDIEACLHAVLRQTLRPEQVIVIDNASNDGTQAIVQRYAANEGLKGNILFISNVINNGFAGGQNQAIAQTDADYVLVLNPDVTLRQDYLAELVAFMESNPQVGSVTGKLVFGSDPSKMDSAGLGMRRTRQAYDLATDEPAANWSKPLEVFGVSGAAAVYRMAMIRDIQIDGQFFDEDYFAYKEDVDVAWRAQKLGWKASYIPSADALHHRGWKQGGRRSVPLFIRRHSYQNRWFTLIKNEPISWQLLWLIPLLTFVEAAKLAYILLREPGLLGSWPVIFKMLPAMLRKRKQVNRKMKEKRS
ncbi:Glycosyltransferase, GT2 family [Paenibacillus algorifonticola]|uniref:Glycosyltransferase, GT2 family n=1 Tax=Paenibacillus algorifonticola TaxID=684063 RepID=A0A1I2DZV6_9BACL|nr:glycosyltransferase family 2 protein [Paenibacillus algorifonticola]SFE85908.1 Glycosyltransferase, GT2 family [Paenibacillus algorifonticola]